MMKKMVKTTAKAVLLLFAHSFVPQLTNLASSPVQLDPLNMGAGLVHVLFIVSVPFPHPCCKQLVASNQSDQPPSTKNALQLTII